MSWAQWWRDLGQVVQQEPSLALRQYFTSVVLTVALCSVLVVLSIVRISTTKWLRGVWSIGVTLVFVAYICFGHLSMAIWSGFPNFIVAITGVIIIGSQAIKPSSSAWIVLIVFAGAASMVTYNWYPLLFPVAPLAMYALWTSARSLVGRQRIGYWIIVGIFGMLITAPALLTLSFGAKHLSVPGGINNLPPFSIVLCLFAGLAISFFYLAQEVNLRRVVVVSPLILALLLQLGVTLPIRMSSGSYPYYPQKIAFGMVFLVLAVSFMLFLELVDKKCLHSSRKSTSFTCLGFLSVCVMLTQIFGYTGPDWKVLAPSSTAPGLTAKEAVIISASAKERISNLLLELETEVSGSSTEERDCLILNDTEMQEYDPVLINYWVGTLTWSLTEEHLIRAQKLLPLRTGQTDPALNAKVVNELLSSKIDCPVVTRDVAQELVDLDSRWAPRTWVIESDGHIKRFMENN